MANLSAVAAGIGPMILNIAAYRFVHLDDPAAVADRVQLLAGAGGLRGTVLVAGEGINLSVAGHADAIQAFLDSLGADMRFAALAVKRSWSATQPFARLKVKLKPEIIAFRRGHSSPAWQRAPSVGPTSLARWIRRGSDDDGRRLVLLDVRNREEVGHGTFAGAMSLAIDNFTDFADAVEPHRDDLRDATIVSFCTGGIRCEKAAAWLHEQGMDNVLQLDGGILGYFEAVGGEGYAGRCFVFDARIAVAPDLTPFRDDPAT